MHIEHTVRSCTAFSTRMHVDVSSLGLQLVCVLQSFTEYCFVGPYKICSAVSNCNSSCLVSPVQFQNCQNDSKKLLVKNIFGYTRKSIVINLPQTLFRSVRHPAELAGTRSRVHCFTMAADTPGADERGWVEGTQRRTVDFKK